MSDATQWLRAIARGDYGGYSKLTLQEGARLALDEIEQLHAAAREVIDGQQDRHKLSSGQVSVDVGSLDALARLLPTKDSRPTQSPLEVSDKILRRCVAKGRARLTRQEMEEIDAVHGLHVFTNNEHAEVLNAIRPESEQDTKPDVSTCPRCGEPADNGHDRCFPPNPYACTKCEQLEKES